VSSLEERIVRLEALVERQHATIVEKNAVIERLQARVAELERKLGVSGKPPSPPSPPSSGTKATEPAVRRPGGQPGHKGHRRELLPPTRIVECMPKTCRGCGETLAKTADTEPLRHQVIDLPPMKPTVDEFRLHRVTCACGVVTCVTAARTGA
jgi:transposase